MKVSSTELVTWAASTGSWLAKLTVMSRLAAVPLGGQVGLGKQPERHPPPASTANPSDAQAGLGTVANLRVGNDVGILIKVELADDRHGQPGALQILGLGLQILGVAGARTAFQRKGFAGRIDFEPCRGFIDWLDAEGHDAPR